MHRVKICICLDCDETIYANFQFEGNDRIYYIARADVAKHPEHVMQSLKSGIIRVGP